MAALERYAGGVRPVTDDFPRIEYAGWVRPREIARVLPEFLGLRTAPPLVDADDALRSEIARQRHRLMDFYAAGLAAYAGDKQGWKQTILRVKSEGPQNTYFQWVMGVIEHVKYPSHSKLHWLASFQMCV